MSVVLYGMELDDNEPYWWGFSIPGPGKVAGFVDPGARGDFFDELRVAAQSGKITVRPVGPLGPAIRTSAYALDTDTGRGWHAHNAASAPAWQYNNSNPAIALYVCCVNPFIAVGSPAYSAGSTNAGDQVGELWTATIAEGLDRSYLVGFSAHKDDDDDPQHPVTSWEWFQFDNMPADTPQNLSHIVSDTSGGDWRASAWGLSSPGVSIDPPGGSYFGVTYSADGWSIQHALLYTGVGSQPASAAAQGTGTGPSVTVATQSGDIVVGAVFCPSTSATITDGADQTRRHTNTGGFVQRQMASSDKAATGTNTTMSWTLSSSLEWSAVAVVLRG